MYIKQGVTIESKDGGYIISSVVRDCRLYRHYVGYTKEQAYKLFKDLTQASTTTNDKRITA